MIFCNKFGRPHKPFGACFRSTFQGREYSIWATKRWKCDENSGKTPMWETTFARNSHAGLGSHFTNETYSRAWSLFVNSLPNPASPKALSKIFVGEHEVCKMIQNIAMPCVVLVWVVWEQSLRYEDALISPYARFVTNEQKSKNSVWVADAWSKRRFMPVLSIFNSVISVSVWEAWFKVQLRNMRLGLYWKESQSCMFPWAWALLSKDLIVDHRDTAICESLPCGVSIFHVASKCAWNCASLLVTVATLEVVASYLGQTPNRRLLCTRPQVWLKYRRTSEKLE